MQLIEFYVKTEQAGDIGERMRDWALPSPGDAVAYRGRPYRVRDVLYCPRSVSGDQLPEPPTVFVAPAQDAGQH